MVSKTQMKPVLCLLVLNEYQCLKVIIPKLLKKKSTLNISKIYAIDGGSIDHSVKYLEKNKIKVIGQSIKGRGNAFKIAFKNIKAENFIFYSPDGNENMNDIKKFKKYFDQNYELIIASRMMKGATNEEDTQIIKLRKWANNFFNFIANFSFNRGNKYITDSINGFRGITLKASKKINISADDFTVEYQMTIRAMKKKLKIYEFPTKESDRIYGTTKAKSIPTGLRFIKRYLSEFFNLN